MSYLTTLLWLAWDLFRTLLGTLGDLFFFFMILLPAIAVFSLLGVSRRLAAKRSNHASQFVALLSVYPIVLISYYGALLGWFYSNHFYIHYREMNLDVLQGLPFHVLSRIGYVVGLIVGMFPSLYLLQRTMEDPDDYERHRIDAVIAFFAVATYVISFFWPSYVDPLVPITHSQIVEWWLTR